MLRGKKIGFIGAGNMGGALIKGILKASIVQAKQIQVAEKHPERTKEFEKIGVNVVSHSSLIKSSDIVILAVKPQDMSALLEDLSSEFHKDQIVISIAAGLTTSHIESKLSVPVPVVRVMPNLPAVVGTGASAYSLGSFASWPHGFVTSMLFDAVGTVVEVSEDQMDTVTALSGSGPAYVFLLAEAMTAAATKEGLPEEIAGYLATQTILGSAKMLSNSDHSPATLRRQVTSPGGTTAAAINVFEQEGYRDLLNRALHAAKNRSEELSQEISTK